MNTLLISDQLILSYIFPEQNQVILTTIPPKEDTQYEETASKVSWNNDAANKTILIRYDFSNRGLNLKVIYHPLYSMNKFVTSKSKLPQDGAQVFPYMGWSAIMWPSERVTW